MMVAAHLDKRPRRGTTIVSAGADGYTAPMPAPADRNALLARYLTDPVAFVDEWLIPQMRSSWPLDLDLEPKGKWEVVVKRYRPRWIAIFTKALGDARETPRGQEILKAAREATPARTGRKHYALSAPRTPEERAWEAGRATALEAQGMTPVQAVHQARQDSLRQSALTAEDTAARKAAWTQTPEHVANTLLAVGWGTGSDIEDDRASVLRWKEGVVDVLREGRTFTFRARSWDARPWTTYAEVSGLTLGEAIRQALAWMQAQLAKAPDVSRTTTAAPSALLYPLSADPAPPPGWSVSPKAKSQAAGWGRIGLRSWIRDADKATLSIMRSDDTNWVVAWQVPGTAIIKVGRPDKAFPDALERAFSFMRSHPQPEEV